MSSRKNFIHILPKCWETLHRLHTFYSECLKSVGNKKIWVLVWWRPLVFHLQPHKPGQWTIPIYFSFVCCNTDMFILLIVHLVFYLIISFTPFHTSCTLALPFMVTLHNNSNQSNSASFQRYFSCIMLTQDVGVLTGFLYNTGQSAHPISQSLVL